ncbi:hypothetical protein D3C75_1337820 [compost metagenome]
MRRAKGEARMISSTAAQNAYLAASISSPSARIFFASRSKSSRKAVMRSMKLCSSPGAEPFFSMNSM